MHPRAARGVTARCRGPSGTDAAPAGARAGGSPAWRAARPVGDRACLDRAASAGPPGWDGPGASTRDRTGRMPGRLPASWRRRMRARERACAPSAPGVPAARRASAAPAPRAVARRWHRCATRSRALDSPAGIDYLSLHAPRASGREPRLRRPSGPRARLLRRGARRVRRAARPERRGQDDALPRHAGLIPVLAGRIVYGFDRRASPPGYVPQKETLDPIFPLTVHEVVLMGTYARLGPLCPVGRRAHRLAAECLAQVGQAELADQPFWALSGGQKQRVLIARALAVEPELLLLDEPTAGIDPGAERGIMDLIARLNRERGLTVVLVSHHLRLVRALVSTVIWVEDGAVTKGPTAALLAPERLAAVFGVGVG